MLRSERVAAFLLVIAAFVGLVVAKYRRVGMVRLGLDRLRATRRN